MRVSRYIGVVGLVAATMGLMHACSDEHAQVSGGSNVDGQTMPVAMPDAQVDAGVCMPSVGPNAWAPPTEIAAHEEMFDGIVCRHPAVHADCVNGWCRVPAGCFIMGSSASEWTRGAYSEDQVAITLTRDFVIGQYEVTQSEWKNAGYTDPSGLLGTTKTGDCTNDPRCPVEGMNFYDVLAYANALSTRDDLPTCYDLSACSGKIGESFQCSAVKLTTTTLYSCDGYRLPTQEEWEYAARAGTKTSFYSGEITRQLQPYEDICCEDKALEPIAWYCNNAGGHTHPVGQKAPNAWGLFDIAGNVEEWVNDPYTGGTVHGPLVDFGGELPSRPASLIMGGSFRSWATLLRHASDAIDRQWTARFVGVGVGFRLVRSLPSRDR